MGLDSLRGGRRVTPSSDISSKTSLPGLPSLSQAGSEGHAVAWPPALSASRVRQPGPSLLSCRDQKRLSGIKGSGRSGASLPTSHHCQSGSLPLYHSSPSSTGLSSVRTCLTGDLGTESLTNSSTLVAAAAVYFGEFPFSLSLPTPCPNLFSPLLTDAGCRRRVPRERHSCSERRQRSGRDTKS